MVQCFDNNCPTTLGGNECYYDSSCGSGPSDGLLEGPHYSRPEKLLLDGVEHAVPAVLLSGHHADIARWRRERALEMTARRRPELVTAARAAGRLSKADEQFLAGLGL